MRGRFSRRGFLAGGLALTLLAAGCGSEGSEPTSPAPSPESAAFPRTVEHKYGETEIAAEPQRVVTVGLSDHDYALALGVVPVAVTDWYGDYPYAAWPWAADALGDEEPEVMPRNEDKLNFELIAGMRPDLIIGQYTGMTEADYQTLSGIAPTVAQSGDFPDFGMPWDETTRVIGRALGRDDQAEGVVSDIEQLFADARAEHPEFDGKTAVVAEQFDSLFVRSASDPRTRFLTDLGFVLPPEIADLAGDRDGAAISNEQIALLDRDLLVWNAGFTPELRGELEQNPLYQQLAVAREGRAVFLEAEPLSGALTWSTVLSLPLAIDELVPLLAAALEG